MQPRAKAWLFAILGFALILLLGYFCVLGMRAMWHAVATVNPTLGVAAITAAATILAGTTTVMLGRYFERKREIEAHFRSEKIKIYDDFLREFFKIMRADDADKSAEAKLTDFLREWQRKLILWGGNNVLRVYFAWMNRLKQGNADAQTIFLMDDFFRALRADIGQRSTGLARGAFANLILRHSDLFLAEAAKNPSITLAELALLEKQRFGDQ
jgi:hypothetical protein